MAIQSFADKVSEQFFQTGRARKGTGWTQVRNLVKRKLDTLHYAARLDDLKSPPGNRLEALHGNLKGFFSIRVNDQWRIVFKWTREGPKEVRIMDHHS